MLKEGVLSCFRLVIVSKYVWLNVLYQDERKFKDNFFLSYNWPLGIDIVTVIKVKNLSRTNFGGFSLFTKGSILHMHYKLGRCFVFFKHIENANALPSAVGYQVHDFDSYQYL